VQQIHSYNSLYSIRHNLIHILYTQYIIKLHQQSHICANRFNFYSIPFTNFKFIARCLSWYYNTLGSFYNFNTFSYWWIFESIFLAEYIAICSYCRVGFEDKLIFLADLYSGSIILACLGTGSFFFFGRNTKVGSGSITYRRFGNCLTIYM
jgi:hypothetical protein